MNEDAKIVQIGHAWNRREPNKPFNRPNPNRGRVYDPNGISPTVVAYSGGGNLEPRVVVPLCTAADGTATTITTRYGQMSTTNITGGTAHYPMTAIMEITKEPTENKPAAEPMVMADPRKSFGDVRPSADVSPTLLSTGYKSPHLAMVEGVTEPVTAALRGRKDEPGQDKWQHRLELGDDVANTLTHANKDSLVPEPSGVERAVQEMARIAGQKRTADIGVSVMPNGDIRAYQAGRADKSGLSELLTAADHNPSHTVTSSHSGHVYGPTTHFRIRKLTPRECYRLMDVPEEAIDKLLATGISKSQHYKLAGNSIVVSCLYHIFKNLFTGEVPEQTQLSLF